MAIAPDLVEDFKQMGREMFEDLVAPGEMYVVPAVYDEISGDLETGEVSYPVEMVMDDILDEINSDDELMFGLVRATLLQEDLAVTPKQGDVLVNENGVRFNVESWTEDPAHVIWQIVAKKE